MSRSNGLTRISYANRPDFAIGGIPPIGHANPLTTLIDEDLLQYIEVWAAAGTPHAVFPIDPKELDRITKGKIATIHHTTGTTNV